LYGLLYPTTVLLDCSLTVIFTGFTS